MEKPLWFCPFFPVGRAKFLPKRNLDAAHISPGEICGLGSVEARFAPPESVMVNKLIFFREGGSEKHPRDIRAMLTGGHCFDEDLLQQ
jgi:hypothetical protein